MCYNIIRINYIFYDKWIKVLNQLKWNQCNNTFWSSRGKWISSLHLFFQAAQLLRLIRRKHLQKACIWRNDRRCNRSPLIIQKSMNQKTDCCGKRCNSPFCVLLQHYFASCNIGFIISHWLSVISLVYLILLLFYHIYLVKTSSNFVLIISFALQKFCLIL